MTPRRTLGAIALVGALLITACSAGSDGAPPLDSIGAPTSPPPVTEPESAATEPPVEIFVEPMSYLDVQAAREAGEIDDATMVLSEFSVLFGVDLDGAIPIIRDEFAPISGSHVLREIRDVLPSLPDDQQAIVEQTLAAVTNGDVVYHSLEDEDYLAAVEQGKTLDDVVAPSTTGSEPPVATEPQGFGPPQPSMRIDPADARGLASLIGTALQRNLGGPALDFTTVVAAEDAARTGTVEALTVFETHPTDGRSCTIFVYDRSRIVGEYLTSVLGHEVMHCWQHVNGPSDTFIDTMSHFYSEGIATWVGEQIAGGSDFGRTHARNYLAEMNYPVFFREYSTFGFWSQVAELRGGPPWLWTIIPRMNAVADEPEAVWNAALDGVSLADRARLASGPLRRTDWTQAWDMEGLGITDDARPVEDIEVSPARVSTVDVRPGAQTAGRFDFSGLPTDTSWVLSIKSSTESSIAAWNIGREFRPSVGSATDFCYGGTCQCPDGSVPLPAIQFPPFSSTEVTIAISGSAFEAANAVVTATDIEEYCEEEPEPTPPLASGAFDGNGTWRATNPALATMFADASAFGFGVEPLDVAGVTGDVVMELRSDGTGTLTYTNVTAFFNDSPVDDLTINGEGNFVFGVEGGVLTVSGNTFTVAASSTALGEEALVITDRDIEGGVGGTSTYTVGFDGNQLVLTSAEGSRGAVFFPILWTRV